MSARPRGNPREEPKEPHRELWDPNKSCIYQGGVARQLAPDKGLREIENSENLSCNNDRRSIANSTVNSKNSRSLCGTASYITVDDEISPQRTMQLLNEENVR